MTVSLIQVLKIPATKSKNDIKLQYKTSWIIIFMENGSFIWRETVPVASQQSGEIV